MDQTAAILSSIESRLSRIEQQTKAKLPWLVVIPVAIGANLAIPYLQTANIPYATPTINWLTTQESKGIDWLYQNIQPYLQSGTVMPSGRIPAEAKGVHPDLVAVYLRANQLAQKEGFTIHISDGLRTLKEQRHYVSIGASTTMNSRHLPRNGIGHALDLEVIYPGKRNNKQDWHWCRRINKLMQQASKELGVPVNWGGNWKSFPDGFHHELPWNYKKQRFLAQKDAESTEQCIPTLTEQNKNRLLAEIKRTESNGGDYQITNPVNGSLGAYQTKAATLANNNIGLIKRAAFNPKKLALAVNAKQHKAFLNNPKNWTLKGGKTAFLNSKELQDKVALKTIENHFKWGVNYDAIQCTDSQKKLTGYAKAAWFGWKNAANWYKNGIDAKDGNKVKVSKYARDGEAIAIEPNKFLSWIK